jgi:hypothetical protein
MMAISSAPSAPSAFSFASIFASRSYARFSWLRSRGQVFGTLAAPACRRQQLFGDEDHRRAAESRTRRHGTQVGPLDGHESRGAALDVDHDHLDAPPSERSTHNGEDFAETWV